MRKLFSVIFFFFFLADINAQVTEQWVQTTAASSGFRTMVKDNGGNIYVSGTAGTGVSLQKYDPLGNLLWTQTYNPAGSTTTNVLAMAIDATGNILISASVSITNATGLLLKYDSNGQLLWTITNPSPSSGIATDENSDFYIQIQNGTSFTLQTIKYNASGTQVWSSSYLADPTSTFPLTATIGQKVVYKNGFVYTTGYGGAKISGRNLRLVLTTKHNATTGARTWAVTYCHADKLNQFGVDLTVDGSGNVYVIGQAYVKAGSTNQNPNWVTLKYNGSGALQWASLFDGTGNDYWNPSTSVGSDWPRALALDASGNLVVAGRIYSTAGGFTSHDIATVKYSSAGALLWSRTFDGSSHIDDGVNGMAIDASSNIYVTGFTNQGSTSATTLKYSPAGSLLWSTAYTPGLANAICLDNSDLYIAGSTAPGQGLLIKYNQAPLSQKPVPGALTEINGLLKVYPNPVHDQLFITAPATIGSISISDLSGRQVMSKLLLQGNGMVNVSALPAGMYIMRVGNRSFKFQKL